ncbi:PEP-CTERM sorting domain-containing protein [Zooshikella sp. RANM57]|uniref:PEP-CTERM sorting domain-containing protein n=1 Tax=Zooshikella sp. RANM57 TaxID=3425863 RepID=UPI003D6E81B3
MTKILSVIIITLFAIITSQSQAGLIYGIQLNNPNLVLVDTMTGFISNVGLLPAGANVLDPVQGLTGMANGTLLYTDGNTLPGVHMLNPSNAGLIMTYALPGVGNRGGLTFDTPSNSLFSVNNGGPIVQQSGLGGVVNTGFIPTIGPFFPGGMGGDDLGRHFAQGRNTIVGGNFINEFNPVTGAVLNTLPLPNNADISGIAFDGTFLYVSELSTNILYTLDPNTGVVFHFVPYTGGVLTALAFTTVPEPSSLALFSLVCLGLLIIRRKNLI